MPVNENLESAGKDFSVKPNGSSINKPKMKSFTSKSQIELEKNPEYHDKKNVHIDTVKSSASMDPTKTTLLVTSQMVTYLLLVSSQQAQPTVQWLRRNSRDNIAYPTRYCLLRYFNVNRQNYGHTKKTSDEQK